MQYDLGEEVYVNLKPYEGVTAKITGAWLNPDTGTLLYNLKFKDGSTLRNAVEGDFTKLPCVESIKIVKVSNVPGAELYSVVEDTITGGKMVGVTSHSLETLFAGIQSRIHNEEYLKGIKVGSEVKCVEGFHLVKEEVIDEGISLATDREYIEMFLKNCNGKLTVENIVTQDVYSDICILSFKTLVFGAPMFFFAVPMTDVVLVKEDVDENSAE